MSSSRPPLSSASPRGQRTLGDPRCTADGDYGQGWHPKDGTFDDWRAKGGDSPVDACCACGGGYEVDILLTAVGAGGCPEGAPVSDKAACEAAADALKLEFVAADKWPAGHAPGCHTDHARSAVWYNGDEHAHNDGAFSLVCMRDSKVMNLDEGSNKDSKVADDNKDDDQDEDKDDEKDDDKDDDQDDATTTTTAPTTTRKVVFQLSAEDKKMLRILRSNVQRTHDALSKNMQERVEAAKQLQQLDVAVEKPEDINAGIKGVFKETKSSALAGLVGDMWKEMRMFRTPFYEERLRETLSGLEEQEEALKAEAAEAQESLKNFMHEKHIK